MPDLDKYIVFVPNSIPPYGYELVQNMALPGGFRFRFRFDEPWVDQDVQSRLSELIGHPGYILLRDFSARLLFPIRRLTVTRARKVGSMYFFDYALGPLIEVDSESDYRADQLDTFRRNFQKFHPSIADSNTSEKNMKPLVFLSNFELNLGNDHYSGTDIDDRQSEAWMNILDCLKDIDFFRGVEFLRVLDVRPFSPNRGEARFENGRVILKEGADYEISVVQYEPHGIAPKQRPNDIRVQTDGKTLIAIKGRQRVVGKYDLLTFVVRADRLSGTFNSFISIEHPDSTKPGEEQYVEPNVYLPATVKTSFSRLLSRIAWFILFLAVYLSPGFVPMLFGEYAIIVRDMSVVGLAVAVVGVLNELKRRVSLH